MPLIDKRNIKNVEIPWPNPFRLKESEITGKVEGLPMEIVTLALTEMIRQRPHLKEPLEELRASGLNSSFSWYETSDDRDELWRKIHARDFDIFYERYTPSKLLERVKAVKNIHYKWERKITI